MLIQTPKNRFTTRHINQLIPSLATALLLHQTPAFASTFDAICGTSRCRIKLEKEQIHTPYGIIPTSRVINWGGGGKTETDLIMGAGATYLLGPVGLLGFAAKVHDYNYSLTGYDVGGKKTVLRIQFKNSKPAKKFVSEMIEYTRLGMNESRSAVDIKRLEARMKANNIKWIGDLPLGSLDEDAMAEKNPSLSNEKRSPLTQASQYWSEHLENNPGLNKWAEKYPQLADQEKSKYKNC